MFTYDVCLRFAAAPSLNIFSFPIWMGKFIAFHEAKQGKSNKKKSKRDDISWAGVCAWVV
jgi:hypothetical protein